MENKKMKIKSTLILLISFIFSAPAYVLAEVNAIGNLNTFSGQVVSIDKEKMTHLIFMDIWSSYGGLGDETAVASLPNVFLAQSQQLWLQPEINVTLAQLAEFEQAYPQVTPLILDRGFNIMRTFNVWQSPYHLIIKGGKREFAGSINELQVYIAKKYSLPIAEVAIPTTLGQELEDPVGVNTNNVLSANISKANKSIKPLAGDKAPTFSSKTLNGKHKSLGTAVDDLKNNQLVSLIFIDTLCPMPQFPGCEKKLAQLNKLVTSSPNRQWIGVVNSYYVNEEYALDFAHKFELKLPLIFDKDNKIFKAYGVYATPYQVDINRAGMIEARGNQLH